MPTGNPDGASSTSASGRQCSRHRVCSTGHLSLDGPEHLVDVFFLLLNISHDTLVAVIASEGREMLCDPLVAFCGSLKAMPRGRSGVRS